MVAEVTGGDKKVSTGHGAMSLKSLYAVSFKSSAEQLERLKQLLW